MAVIVIIAVSLANLLVNSNTIIAYESVARTSRYTTEYSTSPSNSAPNAIAIDANGTVWFTLENRSALAELNPSTGKIREFPLPTHVSGTTSWGMVVDNSRGLVWFTEDSTNSIWSFNIATHKFTQYALRSANAFPFGIALDKQGDVWFTEFFVNKIGEITPSGHLTEIPIPLQGYLEPSAIIVDPTSGKVWFTLPGVNSIGSYLDGKFAFQNLTGFVSLPVGIAEDSQGNIWLTQHGPSFISEFNPTTHYFRTISTSIPSYYGSSLPYFDHVDQYGDIWFNEHEGNAMGEFIPSNNTLIEYFIPTRISWAGNISGMLTSNLSPSGQPWYTEFFAGKVGTINTEATLDLHLRLVNYTRPVKLASNSSVSFLISLSGEAISQATIRESVGNFSSNFTYNVSENLGGRAVTIHDQSAKPGVYFVTISAVTNALVVSQVVELEVE